MAHFWGSVSGMSETEASRRGSKNSGLTTVAASWEGAVRVVLENHHDGDHVTVSMIPWHGRGVYATLYSGKVGETPTQKPQYAMIDAARTSNNPTVKSAYEALVAAMRLAHPDVFAGL